LVIFLVVFQKLEDRLNIDPKIYRFRPFWREQRNHESRVKSDKGKRENSMEQGCCIINRYGGGLYTKAHAKLNMLRHSWGARRYNIMPSRVKGRS
jgi:hypothetical protein